MSSKQITQLLQVNPDLFLAPRVRAKYGCDAYMVPLDNLVKRTTYYFGLFSHRRSDQVWKGLLQIPLPIGRRQRFNTLLVKFRRGSGLPYLYKSKIGF